MDGPNRAWLERMAKAEDECGGNVSAGLQVSTENLDRLYLEWSQFTHAKTARELELEDLLVSARAICQRRGADTAWERFDERLAKAGIGSVTAKVFKVLPSDIEV